MDTGKPADQATKPVHALRITKEADPDRKGYDDIHMWGCWPVLAIETGGYADFEIHDPWTGRRAHVYAYRCVKHQDPAKPDLTMMGCGDCRNTTVYDALRHMVDALEAANFFPTGDELDDVKPASPPTT